MSRASLAQISLLHHVTISGLYFGLNDQRLKLLKEIDMLVLSRKHNETLHIGNDIVITIVRVRGGSVRIGISAPKDIHIMRSELLGTSPKQAATPVQKTVQPKSDSKSTEKSTENRESNSPTEKGPLAKFLKVFPKIELATAS